MNAPEPDPDVLRLVSLARVIMRRGHLKEAQERLEQAVDAALDAGNPEEDVARVLGDDAEAFLERTVSDD